MLTNHTAIRCLAAVILGLLLTVSLASVAYADVAPDLPPEPRGPMLPSPARMVIAGLFLSAAILVVTSILASQRGTPGNRPWARWTLLGIATSVGVTTLLALSSLGQRAAYESRIAAHREEVQRIRREARESWHRRDDRRFEEKRKLEDERRRNRRKDQ